MLMIEVNMNGILDNKVEVLRSVDDTSSRAFEMMRSTQAATKEKDLPNS